MQKFLNPRNDIAFKRLFGTERNKDILLTLLNAVLQSQIHNPIVDVTFLKTYQDPEHIASKQSIVDVLCRDGDGCQYIIEMQVASTGGFEERAQYYASKAYISQMNKGDKYQDLKKVIFLAFTEFSIFPNKESYKSEHVTLDNKTHENDLDKISFTFIDLIKFDKQIKEDISNLSLEEKFYYFLYNAEDIGAEELEKLTSGYEVLDRAFDELNRVYWTEEEINTYEDYEKGIMDNRSAMENARQEGKEEGRKEGRKEGIEEGRKEGIEEGIEIGEKKGIDQGILKGKLETAKNMLQNGISLDLVKKATGLSQNQINTIS